MQITKITTQAKRPDRYSIFVDGRYAFSLGESALLEQKLVPGQELDSEQLVAYKQLSVSDKAYGRALRYAALRPHSTWELETYLKRRGVEESVLKNILNKLSKLDFVDDVAFARIWVENRRLLKPVSRRRLQLELRQKHVSEDIIQKTLASDEVTDRQTLKDLVQKKRQQTKYRNDNLKLMQYLSRQGFNYDDIRSVTQQPDD